MKLCDFDFGRLPLVCRPNLCYIMEDYVPYIMYSFIRLCVRVCMPMVFVVVESQT